MSRARRRAPQAGLALVNALAAVALGASLVAAMGALEEAAIDRAAAFADAGRARAVARGAEAAAVAALRRDAREAPGTDHPGEAWARLGEEATPIEGGSLTVRLEDAQARFNVNSLAGGGLESLSQLRAVAAALRLPAWLPDAVAARVALLGPVAALDDLALGPVEPAMLDRLGRFATALPGRTAVNVNTAEEGLIAALLGNPAAARALVSLRQRKGHLDREDVALAGALLPPGAGLTSDSFRMAVEVRIGTARLVETTLIRRHGRGAAAEAAVVDRR